MISMDHSFYTILGSGANMGTPWYEEAVSYAIQWFMQSTPHRKNVLHEHYTHIGVGVALEGASPGTLCGRWG